MQQQFWGVVLAGGDGMRLRRLSRLISGDDRPKQFCALLGGESLLRQTRSRIAPVIPAARTMFVVVKAHEAFYKKELAGVDEARIVVQPANRGTGTAILYSLLRLIRLDEDALAAFFPTDHDYADDRGFAQSLEAAAEFARRNPARLVILGAKAERAETQYGWIEQGPQLENAGLGAEPVFGVNRFWEKPSPRVAYDLFRKGCLWNTFVLVGRARTFLDTLAACDEETWRAFDTLPFDHTEFAMASLIYDGLPSADFSQRVLTNCTERLAVLGLGDVGWSDLGTPERVRAAAELRAHAWLIGGRVAG